MVTSSSKIYGNSLGQQLVWPAQRKYKDIDSLHMWNNSELLKRHIPNVLDIERLINSGDIIIDVGCGAGCFSAEFKKMHPDVKVWAAGAHELLPENLQVIDKVFYGYIPQQRDLLEIGINKAKLTIETYGPVTYHDNPIDALIYDVLLCQENGLLSCMTSAVSSDNPKSVFGSYDNWAITRQWFENNLNTKLAFIETEIASSVDDKKGLYMKDYLIRGQAGGHTFTFQDYDALCENAHEVIGVPTLGKAWFSADGAFEITEKLWLHDTEKD